MSEPRRMLDEGGSELGLSLLRAAQHDAPEPHARRRTAIALGIGTSIVGAGVTSAGVTSAGSTAAKAGAFGMLKWIGIGIAGGALAIGGASQIMGASEQAPVAVAVTGHAQAVARIVKRSVAMPPAAVVPSPAADELAAPQADVASPDSEPLKEAPKSASPKKAGLAEEVAQLDRVRAALDHGDSQKATEELAEHDKHFGTGSLSQERTVLLIEALALKGDKGGAAALAQKFLSENPTSTSANRVRSILAAGRGEPSSKP